MMNKINKININFIVADKWFAGEWIKSVVIKGNGRGKTLGFPTLNLKVISPKNLKFYKSGPKDHSLLDYKTLKYGVYLCKVKINSQIFQGLLHYGPRPTFGSSKPGLEIHILGFNQKVKEGKKIQFKLLKYLRKIKKFKTKKDLIKQIKNDILLQSHIF